MMNNPTNLAMTEVLYLRGVREYRRFLTDNYADLHHEPLA